MRKNAFIKIKVMTQKQVKTFFINKVIFKVKPDYKDRLDLGRLVCV